MFWRLPVRQEAMVAKDVLARAVRLFAAVQGPARPISAVPGVSQIPAATTMAAVAPSHHTQLQHAAQSNWLWTSSIAVLPDDWYVPMQICKI